MDGVPRISGGETSAIYIGTTMLSLVMVSWISIFWTGTNLHAHTESANETTNYKHSIVLRASLDGGANDEYNDCHNDGVTP